MYEGKVVSLRAGDVQLADGALAFRDVVEHPGGVAAIPVEDGQVILVRQFRIAVNEEILELPSGKLEPGDTPEARARQELEEETGYRAGRIVPAGFTYASVGYTSEKIHLFFASDLEFVGKRPEEDERVEIVWIPLATIKERLARNEFGDAKTVVGLYRLLEHLREIES